jgi:hypothetical protein
VILVAFYFCMGFAQETNRPDVCAEKKVVNTCMCVMNNCTAIKYVYKDVLTSCMSLYCVLNIYYINVLI